MHRKPGDADMRVVTTPRFANMIKPLSAKADKTVVMPLVPLAVYWRQGRVRGSFYRRIQRRASSLVSLAVNLGSFSQARASIFTPPITTW